VTTKDLLIDDGSNGHPLKDIVHAVPQFGTDFGAKEMLTVVLEAGIVIRVPVRLAKLVIATQKKDAVRMQQLQGKQVGRRLDRVWTPIDVITEKHKAGGREIDPHLPEATRKELQILVVSMQITQHVAR